MVKPPYNADPMENAVQKDDARSWLRTAPLQWHERAALAAVPAGVALLFGVGRWLQPDGRGLGTHEQLGMMPCVAIRILDVPCPFCGMTTAVSLWAHGAPVAALMAQPAGAMFAVAAMAAACLATGFALTGRWWPALMHEKLNRGLFKAGAAVVLLAWVYKIVAYRF